MTIKSLDLGGAILLLAAAGAVAYGVWSAVPAPAPMPQPPPSPVVPVPQPTPPRKPCPGPGPCPRQEGAVGFQGAGKLSEGGPTGPDGKTTVAVDLPVDQRAKNVGGRDGSGLCVFTSIMHAARYQGEHRLEDFQTQMRKEPGGGYPSKVDTMIEKYGKGTEYVQYEGGDPAILKAALNTGRMPCVTYNGHDMHYSGGISHMVNLVQYDESSDLAAVLDNNFIAENQLVWMTCAEFRTRWGGNSGWAVVLLAPPPPPPPVARQYQAGPCPCSPACRCGCQAGLPCLCRWGAEQVARQKDAAGDRWEWKAIPTSPGQYALHHNGVQVGAWSEDDDEYRPLNPATKQWGKACVPPVPPPVPSKMALSGNFGVDQSRLCKGACELYYHGGAVVSKDEVVRLVAGDGQIPDDSHKLRLTVIGADVQRQQVLLDLAGSGELAPWRGRLLVKDYPPDHWALRCGFDVSGAPGIYLQTPSGQVLHHQRDYADGAAGLAAALRRADPNYHPQQDPDARNPLAVVGPLGAEPWLVGGMAAGALGVALILRRRQQKAA